MLRVAEHFEKTDTGRQRPMNEDAYFARAPVFAVADGMGGALAGEVASSTVVEVLEPGLPAGANAEERLAAAAREANTRINTLAAVDAEKAGMGTTMTAATVDDNEVAIAHVGDSRAYLVRDGVLERLTRDHSLVQQLVDGGELTEEEAELHPQRSIITRALGPEPHVEVDTRTFRARSGDTVLLCSDGLTSMIREDDLLDAIVSADSLAHAGRALIDRANAAGGRDNITVVLFRLEDVPGAGDGAAPPTEPNEQSDVTVMGESAPSVAEVQAALRARAATEPPTEPRDPAAPSGGPKRTAPLPQRPADPPALRTKRKRRPRGYGLFVAITVILALVLASGWIATRAVYFVATDDSGFVTVFRGLPYDLPAGVELYEEVSISGVATPQLTPAQRKTVSEHRLRSRDDALDLVAQIELGRVRQ